MMTGETIKRIANGAESIRAMAPPGRVVCRWRDVWRLRVTWDEIPDAGELVEFTYIANDKEDFRTLLSIAAVAAAVIPGAQGFAPYLAAAALAYNLLVPPSAPELGDASKSVFTASVSGNTAKLDQPINRTLGVDRVTPPFACYPYSEFRDDDGDNIDNEQYFYAVLAVGYGPYDLLADFLGKTPVNHYSDVLVHALLAPGEQPTVAQCNVFSSSDIGGFELEPKTSPGSYPASPPGKPVEFIGVDIVAPQGLGAVNEDGDAIEIEVKWSVQYRRINDAGAAISGFSVVPGGLETRLIETNTPQRWSGKYAISPPGRVEVRVVRTNNPSTRANARDTIVWTGLRGYSSEPAPLNPNVSHYEIVLRASKQLSQVNQSDINLIVQGKTRTWSPGPGWSCAIGDWDNYVANRNPAWGLADLWSDPVWGEGLPDERIDLLGLYEEASVWTLRQDRIDYTFNQTTDAWSASQLIARAGRAQVFRRYGVRTFRRDALAEAGETLFTSRMCRGGTKMGMQEKRPQSTDPDGILAQYRSNSTWDTITLECPCPGYSVSDPTDPRFDPMLPAMSQPIYRTYVGIMGRTHALREGLYDAADMALRQRTVNFETEMQAIATSFLAPAYWQPLIKGYGQTGDVAFWDADTRMMGLSEPADFTAGALQIILRDDLGGVTEPITVTPGPTAYDVVLAADPGFEIIVDDGTRERPVYALGTTTTNTEIVKTSSITPSTTDRGVLYFSVQAVVDDTRVHAADNAFLPGVGGEQDPIELPGDAGTGDGTEIVVLDGGLFTTGQGVSGGATTWSLVLRNDGTARFDDVEGGAEISQNWTLEPIEPAAAAAAAYEVYYAPLNPVFDANFGLSSFPPRTWASLGTTQTIVMDGPDRQYVTIDVQIRRADDLIVQAVGRFVVFMNIIDLH